MMCENCFPMHSFEGGDLKISDVLTSGRCEHRDNTSIVDEIKRVWKC